MGTSTIQVPKAGWPCAECAFGLPWPAVLTFPSSAHIAGLREAAKIAQERRDGRYKDAHAWVSLDEAADAILARAAELEAPDADV